MRLQRANEGDEPEINLISLIDVIFCIIIFLVVTTTFDVRTSLRLELPTAAGPTMEASDDPLTVVVDAEGRLYLGTVELPKEDRAALIAALSRVEGDHASTRVVLRADARAPHQAVVTAMDALGQAGFARLSIATMPEDGE
ncbi:biopolymer transporter ExbD [Silanimonas sp.]|uniref:ExbD/TolR family protein n=1 Tax=Silanimonas sp. TaxID=1929290 RepID=UPI0022C5E32E|nr:biopolymer transporter ExbD [Silanimonas sp.]MCZ8062998.1 biopolymer transporter ExbD [Silanimonas sp.]MCZ8113459.1 biopolymer transporter ExbD [Silanimonas sp.]MCZ8165516.1 biopolymer transporter ExbD [Silanimonas sp.]